MLTDTWLVIVEKKELWHGSGSSKWISLSVGVASPCWFRVSPEEFASFEIGQRVRVTVERESA